MEPAGRWIPERQIHAREFEGSGNRLSGFDLLPFDKEMGFRLVDRLREIGKSHDGTVAQAALARLLRKPVVSSIIVGASKTQQLQDNLGAFNMSLSAADSPNSIRSRHPPHNIRAGSATALSIRSTNKLCSNRCQAPHSPISAKQK